MSRLLIVGATGLVGGLTLERALQDERVSHVIAPTRRPLQGHDKLDNPALAAGEPSMRSDYWQLDGAVCALGTTRAIAGSSTAFRAVDFDLVLALARRARQAGASRFALVSSMGANVGSRFLYTRTKGEIEEAVEALDFRSLTIVRPGVLVGKREERRLLERATSVSLSLLSPVLPRSLHPSPAVLVARVLLDAALEGPPGVRVVTPRDIVG